MTSVVPGNGFVDVYSPSGQLLKRLISQGDLNSPWGLVLTPQNFGAFSDSLLVGNFGDGAIHAYDAADGQAPRSADEPRPATRS